MPISDKHLTAAKTILTFLTWGRLGKIAILAILSIALTFLWVARDSFLWNSSPATKIPLLHVSSDLKGDIQNLVDKNDKIVAMQIMTINFQKNIKVDTYSSIDNPRLESIYNKVNNNRVIEIPLFDDSKKNNDRILRLINGEFVCIPYTDHAAYKYAPEGANYIGYVCSIGIPPSYGNFSGILSIYLREAPNKEDSEQYFLLSRAIALKIYNDSFANGNQR
jgi:hypothetical protein